MWKSAADRLKREGPHPLQSPGICICVGVPQNGGLCPSFALNGIQSQLRWWWESPLQCWWWLEATGAPLHPDTSYVAPGHLSVKRPYFLAQHVNEAKWDVVIQRRAFLDCWLWVCDGHGCFDFDLGVVFFFVCLFLSLWQSHLWHIGRAAISVAVCVCVHVNPLYHLTVCPLCFLFGGHSVRLLCNK